MTTLLFDSPEEFKAFARKLCANLQKTNFNELYDSLVETFGHSQIVFNNTLEFKALTRQVCDRLNKTKLNQLRHAFAKELGHSHVSTLYATLDDQLPALGPKTAYNGMRVVTFPTAKGGTGKTTCAYMLGMFAAEGRFEDIKKRILIIDFDDQGSISRALMSMESLTEFRSAYIPPIHPDYDPDNPDQKGWDGRSCSISMFFGNPVLPYPTSISSRIEFLPADRGMLKACRDVLLKNPDLIPKCVEELKSFFEQADVQERYDLVIIDLPPGSEVTRELALRACTDVILPGPLMEWSLSSLEHHGQELSYINRGRDYPFNMAAVIPILDDFFTEGDEVWDKLDREWRSHEIFGEAIPSSPIKSQFFGPISHACDLKSGYEEIINHISQRMYGKDLVNG